MSSEVILFTSSVPIELHGDIILRGYISKALIDTTKYAESEFIKLEMKYPVDEFTLSYYSKLKISLLIDGLHCDKFNMKLYQSLIELAIKLDDVHVIDELIEHLWDIENLKDFDECLSMFTDKQLWMELIIQGRTSIDLNDSRYQQYLIRLVSASKYYRMYKNDIFEEIRDNCTELPTQHNSPELTQLFDEYNLYSQLFK